MASIPNIIPNIIPTIKPKIFIPIWLYKWLALMPFIGFFGFDHWAIDSKFTGIAKLFVNIFTLGSWYAYDIVQAWNGIRADKKTLQSDGLDIPFFEGFNIGKGKFDAEPVTNMSNNSQMWLLILFIGLFAFIYYILGFFLTSESGFFITSLASIAFYGIFALSAYTIFFYIMSKTAKGTSFTTPKTTTEAKSSLYSSFGVANPLTTRQSKSRVGSILSSVTPSLSLPRMSGGGNGLSDLVETLKKMEPKPINMDHLYFISLLLVLPVSGFIAYGLIKNKKRVEKDEVS
jgi:hypothetical protein